MSEEEAFRFVKDTLKKEKITPFHPDEIEIVKSVESCINCGLCLSHCPVVSSVGLDVFSGPRSIAVELSRSPPEFWTTGDKVYLCTGCGTCREVCPKNVNIPEIVNIVRARIFKHRPDLVPDNLHDILKTINDHKKAFAPWDDEEDKEASRDMRLERLGLPDIPDPETTGAEVLFYPGCQAEEIAQEVREAAKVIFEHFNVDYMVLDELSCCGMPARLIGDDSTARDLNSMLKEKVRTSGAKMVVTTCAGCTSNISDIAVRDDWGIPVYHMIEYIVEHIGLDALSENTVSDYPAGVTLHDPCHLIKHTDRHIMDSAMDILQRIEGVEIMVSQQHDSCCGGGGMVGHHTKVVSRSVVKQNIRAIEGSGAERVVTPCPLCTAQLEDNLYRAGSSTEVDDLTVFIAKRLVKRGD